MRGEARRRPSLATLNRRFVDLDLTRHAAIA